MGWVIPTGVFVPCFRSSRHSENILALAILQQKINKQNIDAHNIISVLVGTYGSVSHGGNPRVIFHIPRNPYYENVCRPSIQNETKRQLLVYGD
jgi:hypothetical protein